MPQLAVEGSNAWTIPDPNRACSFPGMVQLFDPEGMEVRWRNAEFFELPRNSNQRKEQGLVGQIRSMSGQATTHNLNRR